MRQHYGWSTTLPDGTPGYVELEKDEEGRWAAIQRPQPNGRFGFDENKMWKMNGEKYINGDGVVSRLLIDGNSDNSLRPR